MHKQGFRKVELTGGRNIGTEERSLLILPLTGRWKPAGVLKLMFQNDQEA